jgi:hypothetical protein
MKRALALAMSAAVLTTAVAAAPAAAERFDDRGGRRPSIDRGRLAGPPPTVVRPFDPRFDTLQPVPAHPSGLPNHAFTQRRSLAHPQARPAFPGHHRGFEGRGFKGHGHGSVIVGSGPVVVYSPGYAPGYAVDTYAEPSLYAAPQYAAPPAPAVAAAPPPPAPTVVEHETGRYELRGDGLTVPYRWVWVPNPPAAPPEVAAAPSPPSAQTAPPRRSTLYTWTDRDGVVHWTDNAGSVSQEYRSKVQKRPL